MRATGASGEGARTREEQPLLPAGRAVWSPSFASLVDFLRALRTPLHEEEPPLGGVGALAERGELRAQVVCVCICVAPSGSGVFRERHQRH